MAVGAVALRERVHDATPASAEDHGARALLRELGQNSQALLAFFAVTNVDVILARNVLDNADSGLYAGGLILTKAVLFLPQFVVVVAFPDMADAARPRAGAAPEPRSRSPGLGVVGVAADLRALPRRPASSSGASSTPPWRTGCGSSRSSARCSR